MHAMYVFLGMIRVVRCLELFHVCGGPLSSFIALDMQLMLALMLAPLMVEVCGAWVSLASLPKAAGRSLESRSTGQLGGGTMLNGRHHDPVRCRPLLLQKTDDESPLSGAAEGAPSSREDTTPGENGDVGGGSEGGESNSNSSSGGGGSVVRATLEKPVGLVLAERAIGQPGLVVDDMVDGGSAKESGIVVRGMSLISACGVECGTLLFDQVAEMLQNSSPEAPIDFVFSPTVEPMPPCDETEE